MPISRKFLKNLDKKINCVFFIGEDKTRHFKVNYIFFKFLLVFFSVSTLLVGILLFIVLHTLKEKKSLAETVLNFKSYYVHNYFETRFNMATQDEINETSDNVAETNLSIEKSILSKERPKNARQAPQELLAKSQIEGIENTKKQKASPNNLTSSSISVDKETIQSKNNNIVLSFWLLNAVKNKGKTMAGSVCVRLVGVSLFGKEVTLNYPSGLKFGTLDIPTTDSCSIGERVKFSRLRPVTFEFDAKLDAFKTLKASIYFLEKNTAKPILLKEIKYN